MRGEGWECDECGGKSVVPRASTNDYWDNSRHTYPQGWIMTIVAVSNNMMDRVDEQHFCSWKCLNNYSYIKMNELIYEQ